MTHRRLKRILKILISIFICLVLVLLSAIIVNSVYHNDTAYDDDLCVSDIEYKYVFNYGEDMQLPELPTGCEATALAILLRMNGVPVDKTEIADAMPKSYDGDFVYSFWGNPYSDNGFACMAPCSVNTANIFLDNSYKIAVEYTGTNLKDLPLPSAVWVTTDIEDPIYSGYEKDGYKLFYNTHCVVVERISNGYAYVADPLNGRTKYPLSQFESVYDELGSQAVYIKNVE